MRIVLVDTGVSFHTIPNYITTISGISINYNDGQYLYDSDYNDKIGHGTIVANLLAKYLNKEIDLYVIKIFHQSLEINVDLLMEALDFCDKHLECDLIQLSIGTLVSSSKLEKALQRLIIKNIAIIAAFDNYKCISYPAAYTNVIGVDVTQEYKKIDEYCITDNQVIDIRGADVYHRTQDINGKSTIVRGSSFYCSYISALIINANLSSYSKNNIMNFLLKNAMDLYTIPKLTHKKIYIKRAIVFPFNKEIHSIAAFERLVSFEILSYTDIRQTGRVNHRIIDIIPYSNNYKVLMDFEKIDWEADFDTFICGHVSKLYAITGVNYIKKIVDKCEAYNKQLICFDNVTEFIVGKNINIWFPNKTYADVPLYRFGKLRSPSIPIIGVFGTNSRQGKMTVQLLLREHFLKRGIKIKNIGSEPESFLFGFEYMYCFGYASTDELQPLEMVQTLNEAVFLLEKESCDAIIVGSQSGTIPHQLRNIDYIPYKQYMFLLGTQPDSIILMINGYDSIEYVKRTILFFEATVAAKVICLIVSYMDNTDSNIEFQTTDYFERKCCIPTFNLQDLDTNDVIDLVLQYYNGETI